MHFVYRFYDGNGRAAVVEYRHCFQNCRLPHQSVVYNVRRSLRGTGSSTWANAEYEQQWHDSEGDVLSAVQRSPHTGLCRISTETGIPWSQVWRTLHSNGIYAFHIHMCSRFYQEISWKDDYSLWITFCSQMGLNLTMMVTLVQELHTLDLVMDHIE
jgi:hypothetical protein